MKTKKTLDPRVELILRRAATPQWGPLTWEDARDAVEVLAEHGIKIDAVKQGR